MNAPLPDSAFSQDLGQIADVLDVDITTGLDESDIVRRRKLYGANRLRQQAARSALSVLLEQFTGIIVWLLAAAAAFSLYLGDMVEALAIVVVLLINGTIGFVTELRAARSMEALHKIAEVKTRVRRNGQSKMVDAHELVPGDVVLLDAGDVVTADLRLLHISNLHIDESVLTGESMPVIKQTQLLDGEVTLAERTNMAYKGTAVTQGTGESMVIATGVNTELGRISDLTQQATAEESLLEKRLDKLGHKLVWLTFGLTGFIVAAGVLRGHDLNAMIETGIALAVAAVPEGLPVVATLCLARGMLRMAQRNALVARLSAVETLGATTLILTDKTGTLTENRMTAVTYLLAQGDVTLDADNVDGMFMLDDCKLDPKSNPILESIIKTGALCNTASLGEDEHRAGDPMELALLDVAKASGYERSAILANAPEQMQHAFNPDFKMMATVHASPEGALFAVKGAPESVLGVCDRVATPDGTVAMDKQARKSWAARAQSEAARGLRLLALAYKTTSSTDAEPYQGLVLLGIVCLSDPLREDVPEAIAASLAAGVRVVMMTGDHADTASEIAQQAGIGAASSAQGLTVINSTQISAMDLDNPSDQDRERIMAADVFARVSPSDKLKIVTLYQKSGHVIAMTGDGVNDAPALKKADIGIAMGQRGTQVAREAAQMVLNDDAFATIIVAMHQGRVIFANIRKFVLYLMSCNVSEVMVVGLAVGAGLPAPLLPLQILFLNLVTDVFPAFALGLGRGGDGVMDRPPRNPAEPILDKRRWAYIALLGSVITTATLSAFALSLYWLELSVAQSITVAFVTLALAQLWNVFNMREAGTRMLVNEVTCNPWIWAAIALCLALIAAALWWPGLAGVLKLPSPGVSGLALAASMSTLHLIGGQIVLWLAPPDAQIDIKAQQ